MKESISTYLKFGSLLESSGKIKKAKNVYEMVINKWPNDFRPYFNLGNLLIELEPLKALSYFEKAKLLYNENNNHKDYGGPLLDVYGPMSKLLITLSRSKEAVILCNEAVELVLNNKKNDDNLKLDLTCSSNLNVAFRLQSKIDEAIELSWKLMHLEPFKFSPLSTSLECRDTDADSNSSSHSSNIETITIVVLKWGTKYDARYVNRLYQMISKYGSFSSFNMICYTEDSSDIIEAVICRTLPDLGWKGWWYKAYLFSEATQFHGTILYLDLDTVICGNLDFLVDFNRIIDDHLQDTPYPFLITLSASTLITEARDNGINSSIMCWKGTSLSQCYDFLRDNYYNITSVIHKFDHFLEMMLLHPPRSHVLFYQDLYPGRIVDYGEVLMSFEMNNTNDQNGNGISVICFPLNPKPHELALPTKTEIDEEKDQGRGTPVIHRIWNGLE